MAVNGNNAVKQEVMNYGFWVQVRSWQLPFLPGNRR